MKTQYFTISPGVCEESIHRSLGIEFCNYVNYARKPAPEERGNTAPSGGHVRCASSRLISIFNKDARKKYKIKRELIHVTTRGTYVLTTVSM